MVNSMMLIVPIRTIISKSVEHLSGNHEENSDNFFVLRGMIQKDRERQGEIQPEVPATVCLV